MSSKLVIRRSRCRRAFSFAEVMFAVVILGVGFIMIAGLFPVAIRQSKSTVDETSAAAFARVAANDMTLMATDTSLPMAGTGTASLQAIGIPLRSSTGADTLQSTQLWESVRGNIISATDPRYAWVPFYFRGLDPFNKKLPYAQLILICVQATNKPIFTDADVRPNVPITVTPVPRANLRGRPVRATIINSPSPDPDFIGFGPELKANFDSTFPNAVNAVAEGCFVIIRGGDAAAPSNPALNGRIYRVGVRRSDLDTATTLQNMTDPGTGVLTTTSTTVNTPTALQWWELAPGNDFNVETGGTVSTIVNGVTVPVTIAATNPPSNCPAWIVGRSFADPNNSAAGFEGPAMDVSAYSTIVFCKP